jgi:hypothetical protein
MNEYDLSQPLLIYGPKYELLWTNPDMLDLMTFQEPDEGSDTVDSNEPVHRVFLNDASGKHVMHVIMRSAALDTYWENALKDVDFDSPDWKKTDPTAANEAVERLQMELETCFIEDVWMPGGKQFCFTPVGRKVGTLLKKVKHISFSPDCMLWKSGLEFGYDT